MHWFTYLFLFALLLVTGLRLWLSKRQVSNVARHRDAVPAPFDQKIALEQHQKAADYTVAKSRFGRIDTIYDVIVLLIITLGGGLALIDRYWQGYELGPVWTGIAVIISLMIATTLISLPVTLYSTFVIEEKFGFNRMTPGLFVIDMLKGFAVMLLLGTPLIAAILWIMHSAGTLWWFYAWLVWTGFSVAITWAYPRFISPMFNKFSPIEDQALRDSIEALMARCGFKSKGIFVMDGSKRSSHGNAYFTGIGNNKRIVFFDTLIDSLETLEIEAVLAHELGHFRKNHVRKRLILTFGMSLLGLAVLGFLKEQAWFYAALGVTTPSDYGALILFTLVMPVFTFLLTPLGSLLSRRHEFEADEYAAEQSDAQALIRALVKLYRDNATTLTPDPVHSRFYDSHPPAPIRVARLNELAATSN